MGEKITVVAKPGRVCPRENPREPMITDTDPVSVTKSVYYIRLLADGSLLQYTGKRKNEKASDK